MKSSYKKEAVKGVKWTGLSSSIIALGSFLLILVLTRLLRKEDFGLFALVNVVVGFSSEFVDVGISQAIIQKQQVTKKQLSSLYWLNILFSLIVFSAVYFGSGLIAGFFDSQELKSLLEWISISFILSGISVQYQAIFQKEMRFKLMAKIEMFSFVGYVVSVLVFVYMGYGVLSLIWGTIIRTSIKSFLSIAIGFRFHVPTFYLKLHEVKPFLNFGTFKTGAFLVAYLNNQLDSILIGKFIGVGELGMFDVFKRIAIQPVRFIAPVIQKVTFPLLAKVSGNRQRVSGMFLKTMTLLNTLQFPIFIGIALCAPEISDLILGDSWTGRHEILQLFCMVYLFSSIQSFVGQGMIAQGRADWALYNNLIMLPINIAVIYFGSMWGVMGVLVAMLFRELMVIIPRYFLILRKLYDISLSSYLGFIFKDFIVVASCALVIYIGMQYLSIQEIVILLIKCALFGIGLMVLFYWFYKERLAYVKSLVLKEPSEIV